MRGVSAEFTPSSDLPTSCSPKENGDPKQNSTSGKKTRRQILGRDMPKSERQRQKKADAKERRDRKRKTREAQRAQTNQTLAGFRRKAPMIKRLLKKLGHEWQFYDYLDSYRDAFDREKSKALHP